MSASASSGSGSRSAKASSTTTWHVEHAAMPPQVASMGTPALMARSSNAKEPR
eukprot:CAMPEP_0118870306 /NCGR_PEP_ID=MMETSP1163-20130328/13331_1 /TAXON_ID=124430 /ORGANISM="Phaeomonas parva, Strain CCMP2877" /LENGTH=52 /DNA_ID=CAMNT_0006805299 /DNA_START=170 /DNA_END=324 /DNA_ORIENTATION=-